MKPRKEKSKNCLKFLSKSVDNMDQEISYFKFPHKSNKWWKPVFFHLFEIVLNNSRIWYQMYAKSQCRNFMKRLFISWMVAKKRTELMKSNPHTFEFNSTSN